MKIRQVLVEAAGATVAFAFGRFNPAHQGHVEVWRAVENAGANWFIGTNPNTLGPNDPLTFEQKSAWMEEIYPPIQGHIVPEQSVLTLAAYIFKKLRKNERATVAYITDAEDWAWSGKLLNQYNGVEGSHGYYKFAQIIHEPSPRVSSATALREAARADDKVAFYHASGTDPNAKVNGLTYFDTVKQAVEKYPLPVKRGQKVKQQGVAEASYMSVDDYKNNLQNALPSIIEYYQDELGFTPSKEQLASAVKAALATMEKTGDTEQAGESLEAVLDSFVPSNASNKNSPKIDFKKNLLQVLQQKYPDAEFKIGPDRVESTDGQLSVIADTEQEGRYVGCFMWDVSTGPYKGALGLAIKQTTDQLLQANPGKKPALFISGDNQNPEAWSHIAKKLKYKLITDENELEEGTKSEGVEEASLATMRDYFAGDENAKDQTKLSQMRDFFSKHKPEGRVVDKNFNSKSSYEAWLKQQKMKKIGEDEEAGEVEKTGTLIPFPKGTTKIDVGGEYDWYKLGQVISDLDDADPAQFGKGPASAMIAFGSEAEEHKYMPLLKRLGMRLHDIDQPTEGVEIIPVAEFISRHQSKLEAKFTDYELAVMEGGHSLPEAEKIAGRYDPADFDSMVQRLSKIAKAGPMKTVWDPEKRVYKNVPDTDKQKKIAEAVVKVVEVIKQRKGLWKNK